MTYFSNKNPTGARAYERTQRRQGNDQGSERENVRVQLETERSLQKRGTVAVTLQAFSAG